MRIMTPVEEKMYSEAEFGMFYLHYVITQKKAQELQELGFEVTDLKESKSFPRSHKIDWSKALDEEISNSIYLNEKCDIYTLPQKLWIIAAQNTYSKA